MALKQQTLTLTHLGFNPERRTDHTLRENSTHYIFSIVDSFIEKKENRMNVLEYNKHIVQSIR